MKNRLKQLIKYLPLVVFSVLLIVLGRSLSFDPKRLPSALLDKPLPTFQLSTLDDTLLTNHDLKGHVSLLHIWATWCPSCLKEHRLLLELTRETSIPLFGISYKDGAHQVKQWLTTNGDPYQKNALDREGRFAIDLGVYGTPETFVIDQDGIIRYKHVGPITRQIWGEVLLPVIANCRG